MYLFRFTQMITVMMIVKLKQLLLSVIDHDLDMLHHVRDHVRLTRNIENIAVATKINQLDQELAVLTQSNQRVESFKSVISLYLRVQRCYTRHHNLRIMMEQDKAMYSLFDYCVRGES